MSLKVEIGLMDLWHLWKIAKYVIALAEENDENAQVVKQKLQEIATRLPDELKLLDVSDPETTINIGDDTNG